MISKKVGVAIAGCGKITQVRHAPEYTSNENVKIIGFYDNNTNRANELATIYNAKSYNSYEELLCDNEVDALSVCVPNNLHAQYSIDALKAGKDVLCEKPMAISLDQAKAMIEAEVDNNKILMIGNNQRLVKAHVKARELIQQGIIGKILTITTSFTHSGPESWSIDGGGKTWFFNKKIAQYGVLGDLGIHKVDILRYLTCEEIEEIITLSTTLDKKYESGEKIELEDNSTSMIRMSGNITATMNVSWTNYGKENNSTIIYGTKGIIRIFDSELEDIIVQIGENSQSYCNIGGISTNDKQVASGVIDAFVSSIITRNKPFVTSVDGYNALAVLDAAVISSKEHQWVKVKNYN